MIFYSEESASFQKKLKENKTKCHDNRTFHDSMKYLMFASQFFGLFPLNGILNSDYKDMRFSWRSFRTIYSLIIFCIALVESHLCVYFMMETDEPFEIIEMNVTIFYIKGTLTCLSFLKLATYWTEMMKEFDKIENMLRSFPSSKFLHTKLKIISFGMCFAAAVEHFSIEIINLVRSIRCEVTLARGFYHFFAFIAFKQMFFSVPYNFFVGVGFQLMNWIITSGWTFIDVFIICASMNFSEKLVQLKKQICVTVEEQVDSVTTWRDLREIHTELLNQFANFNEKLNNIILISFTFNIYYLLTQVYLWMRSNWNEQMALHQVYFIFSLSLLVSRTSLVCFYGASIEEESDNLLNTLAAIPSNIYNAEVERFIVQVNTSPLILSGNKYFYITRSLILKIAGSVVTYELVMIQFTEVITKDTMDICQ